MTSLGRTSIGFLLRLGGGAKRDSPLEELLEELLGGVGAGAGAASDEAPCGASGGVSTAGGGISGSGKGGAAAARPDETTIARSNSALRAPDRVRKGRRVYPTSRGPAGAKDPTSGDGRKPGRYCATASRPAKLSRPAFANESCRFGG